MGLVKKKGILDKTEFIGDVMEHSETISQMDDSAATRREQITIKEIDLVPLSRISGRKNANLRPANLPFIIDTLAPSILATGLIHPIVLDQDYALIAGEHRWVTLQILAMDPQKRREWILTKYTEGEIACSNSRIEHYANQAVLLDQSAKPVPVRIFKIETESDYALAIEIAENDVRRDFSQSEVEAMKLALEARGYAFGGAGGRPKAGQPRKTATAAIGIIAKSFHKSERHIRRLLAPPKTPKVPKSPLERFQKELKLLLATEISDDLREWAEKGEEILSEKGLF